MKQIFLSGRGQVAVLDTPIPSRLRDGILIRTAFSVISAGTEGAAVTRRDGLPGLYEKLNNSRDRLDQVWGMVKSQGLDSTLSLIENKLNDHAAIGYSSAGVVVEVDNDGVGFRPGDRVVAMGAGVANHAEYSSIPKNLTAKIPDKVRFEDASFGAIACIAMQGVRRLELQPGEQVAIVGLGLIGQIAFRLAAIMGYQPYGFDIDQARVDLAANHAPDGSVFNSNGSDPVAAAHSVTGGQGFDGIVICASAKADLLVNQVFDMCRKRGRVSIVGDVGLGLERARMYAKELELRLSCSYGVGRYDQDYEIDGQDYPLPYVRWTQGRNLKYFLDLLAAGRLDISDLVSRIFRVEEAAKAYAEIKSDRTDVFGVLLDYKLPEMPKLPEGGALVRYHESVTPAHTLSIGMVGVGAYAKNVHIPNLLKIEGARINGIASRSGGSAAVVASRVKAGFATSDASKLLRHPDINAVVISTRHSTHAALAVAALEAGNHVYIEKPMATTIADCLKIVSAQRASGRLVRVGYNRRFSPFLRKMKLGIGGGQKLFNIRVNVGDIDQHWSNTTAEGGRLLGEGVHFFDLATWMMDSEPVAVSAQFIGKPGPLNPDASICIRYANGSVANVSYVTLGATGRGKEYFEVFGNRRVVTIDDYRKVRADGCRLAVARKDRGDKGQFGAMVEFVNAARTGGGDGGAGALEGLWATAVARAAVESARENKTVLLSQFISSCEVGK